MSKHRPRSDWVHGGSSDDHHTGSSPPKNKQHQRVFPNRSWTREGVTKTPLQTTESLLSRIQPSLLNRIGPEQQALSASDQPSLLKRIQSPADSIGHTEAVVKEEEVKEEEELDNVNPSSSSLDFVSITKRRFINPTQWPQG